MATVSQRNDITQVSQDQAMPFGTELFYQTPDNPVQAMTVKNEVAVGDKVTIGPKVYQVISFKTMVVPEYDEAQRVAILREAVARIRYT